MPYAQMIESEATMTEAIKRAIAEGVFHYGLNPDKEARVSIRHYQSWCHDNKKPCFSTVIYGAEDGFLSAVTFTVRDDSLDPEFRERLRGMFRGNGRFSGFEAKTSISSDGGEISDIPTGHLFEVMDYVKEAMELQSDVVAFARLHGKPDNQERDREDPLGW